MRLVIVGSGPMALYVLKHLKASPEPLAIEVLEASETAGAGMPYRADMNADSMLCNAFSREIPYATQPLIDWLEKQPARELSAWELSWHDLSARAFYPRVLIGEYLQSEFDASCAALRAAGHEVNVRPGHRVEDIVPGASGFTVRARVGGEERELRCDDVVIASGHVWPKAPEIDGVELVSPWPYTNITGLPASAIGVLGSSLSAIDVVVALAEEHGAFTEEDEQMSWAPNAGAEGLRIRMVSLRGVMPEGDFYYPFPYEPLEHITDEAVLAEVAKGPAGLLERVFRLLLEELDHADPSYLTELGQDARTIEGFADAYFARRERLGGLRAVKRDLVETRRSMRERRTIPHRYALLRGHEAFDLALRHLSEEDFATFSTHLMPVFADCYAAVPHLSLARVVALYDAGVLSLHTTASDSAFTQLEGGRVQVATTEGPLEVDHMVDARGQAPHGVAELRFPALVDALADSERPIEAPFRLALASEVGGHVYCLAMPQLLQRHPFSQGLPGCDAMAEDVTADLLSRRG
tara:strand:- start:676 stop:2247 length:1572 start_codon:yes stop_codon:yes gene_type:complete